MEVNEHFSDRAKEDLKFVEQALEGNQAAFSALMVRYREPIYYLVFKMVNHAQDAEDISIEAIGKAFKNLSQYSTNYAFSTWLFRIATNHCIDFIRKKKIDTTSINKTMKNKEGDSFSVEFESSSKDPEDQFIEKQKIEIVRNKVTELDEPYRTLVELRYFKELSYDEIAEQLKIPLGTVKAQLFRSRALLAELIRHSKKHL